MAMAMAMATAAAATTAVVTMLLQLVIATQPPASSPDCVGVMVEYQVATVTKIFPFLSANESELQPFRFQSSISLTNTGFHDVKGWQVFVGFQHREWLTRAEGAVLSGGQPLPLQVGNAGVVLVGFPQTDISNSIETSGDYSKIQLSVNLVGTEFGVAPPGFPLPTNLSLVNDGYDCGPPRLSQENRLRVCCAENRIKIIASPTMELETSNNTEYLPHETGDVTISYDVLQSFDEFYWAQVTISNTDPVGRLDNWKLSWQWKQGEFIQAMKGAQTLEQDQSQCIRGPPGSYYKDFDFSRAMNCQRSPTIVDLDESKANDTQVGQVPFCCRNGTILPVVMDPSRSKSAFQMQVYKVKPNIGRDKLVPPAAFSMGGKYLCGQPRLVLPAQYPAPGSSLHYNSAVASWEVTCNLKAKSSTSSASSSDAPAPACCVSFSAFYNNSVVPCRTCACGCPASPQPACNPTAEALLVPAEALLVPSSNRTAIARSWNTFNKNQKKSSFKKLPESAPCSDYCGISINWHVLSDHERGWVARMSILNWDQLPVADWFAVVELDKAIAGYQKSYSFNGTLFQDRTTAAKERSNLFLQGKPGFNYINGDQLDNQLPGKAQSIISFSKKGLNSLRISGGDGFPSKVIFNGEECALPTAIPQSASSSLAPSFTGLMVLLAASIIALV